MHCTNQKDCQRQLIKMANPTGSYRRKHSYHHVVQLHVLAFTLISCCWTICFTYAEETDMDKMAEKWTKVNGSQAGEGFPFGPITILPGDCLHELFSKYSSGGRMDEDGFEKLLKNLGLGKVPNNGDSNHHGEDHHGEDHHGEDHHGEDHHGEDHHGEDHQGDNVTDNHHTHESDRGKRAVANVTSAPAVNEGKGTSYVPTPISKPSSPELGDSMTTGVTGETSNDTDDHGVHTDHHQDDGHQTQCLSAEAVLDIFDEGVSDKGLTEFEFLQVCPVLLQQLDTHVCVKLDVNDHQPGGVLDKTRCETDRHDMEEPTNPSVTSIPRTWGYAFAAITLISMASIVCILVVPCMQRFPKIYARLLSFLVAVAVGTLSGDAVMHLMPHAFGIHGHKEEVSLASTTANPGCEEVVTSQHDHHGATSPTSESVGSDIGNNVVIKGLVVLMGIFSFFVIEQLMQMCRSCREKRHKSGSNGSNYTQLKPKEKVGSKLCNHNNTTERLSIVADPTAAAQLDALLSNDKAQPTKASVVYNCHDRRDSQTSNNSQPSQHVTICVHSDAQIHISPNPSHDHNINDKIVAHAGGDDHKHEHNDYQHDSHHEDHHHHDNLDGHEKSSELDHGHGHHGHSHTAPPADASIATLAWIVVMGDGLHNFCDGLVVGAAFADSLAGGLSTAIAVMCHELPHELGDFAVMLKAGMSIKQALAFQGVSSILAYVGMAIGVAMGNVSALSLWIFALAAGMFLYIALADLFPEMVETIQTTPDSKGLYLLLQILGVMCGIGLMLTIGLLEEDLMAALNSFNEV